jgi:hypothetical protein
MLGEVIGTVQTEIVFLPLLIQLVQAHHLVGVFKFLKLSGFRFSRLVKFSPVVFFAAVKANDINCFLWSTFFDFKNVRFQLY